MRSYLVLDIETVPDAELPWDAATQGFPPPPFHKLVALGVLWLGDDYQLRRMGVFGERYDTEEGHRATEAQVLEEFAEFVGKFRPHLVTYNGRGFDLPVLANRCLRHGVPFPAYYTDRDYRYRFSDVGHIDLGDVMSDYGASRMSKLDHLAHLIGMPGKMEVDGSMVGQMYDQGRIDEIRTYCLHDVIQTAFLFLRVEVLRGKLELARYRECGGALWDALAVDPRAEAVLDSADRARVLLEGVVPS